MTTQASTGTWEAGRTYVIGHQRPDTDSIGAALGYAWLLQAQGQREVVAARAGQVSVQTAFVLERFGWALPLLLVGRQLARRSRGAVPAVP